MKNPHLLLHRRLLFSSFSDLTFNHRQCFTVNSSQLIGYVYHARRRKVYEISESNKEPREIFDLASHFSGDISIPELVALEYLCDTDSVCLAIDNGDVIVLDPHTEGNAEVVGVITDGLVIMEWSPSQDLVLFATKADTIALMTSDFDLISDINLHSGEEGLNTLVQLGWGKKETQFHGSEGKAAAKAKPEDYSIPEVNKDGIRISWRSDGELFSVNFAQENKRWIRVYNKSGSFLCVSEYIPGLESSISWSNKLMTCPQLLPNKHVVCFIEKNGLKHGDFLLPFPPKEKYIKKISWNADSTMLLVWWRDQVDKENSQETISIFTMMNYHWYAKQKVNLQCILAAMWDPIIPTRLHIISHGCVYHIMDYTFKVYCSEGKNLSDAGFVAVIDGARLLLTSFRQSVIPPPMCGTSLNLESQVKEVIFAPRNLEKNVEKANICKLGFSSNDFLAVLTNGDVSAYQYCKVSASDSSHNHYGTYSLDWDSIEDAVPSDALHHWVWVNSNTLLCNSSSGTNSTLYILSLPDSGSENGRMVVRKKIDIAALIITITRSNTGNYAFLQLLNGEVRKFNWTNFEQENFLPPLCPRVQVVACVTVEEDDKEEMILGLSEHNHFYANNKLLSKSVSSVALHSHFLIVTTLQHELICVPLKGHAILSLSEYNSEKVGSFDGSVRRIERGSRIVTVVPESNRVILQMPRGNLECIEPRALSLFQLGELLDNLLFYEAFDLARKQRINLNILVDHNPDLFLNHVDEFVDRVANPQWLSLFLAELQCDDCTTTMYRAHYKQPRIPYSRTIQVTLCDESAVDVLSSSTKIHIVCDAILNAIEKRADSKSLALPTISGLVRKRTDTDLEKALKFIKKIKTEPTEEMKWTDALRHLLYLKDIDQLMNAALATYDFELVLLIATKSQKDPKEYLGFLNTLRKMDLYYQRFSIDKHLKKWDSALLNLLHCDGEKGLDELFQFIDDHNLYKTALRSLPPQDERYKKIAGLYANKLMTTHNYMDAGLLYRRAGQFQNALKAHRKALLWRNCIEDAKLIHMGNEEQMQLWTELTVDLQASRRYSEAAEIFRYYIKDPVSAIKILCDGHIWVEAIQFAVEIDKLDLIDSLCRPRVLNQVDALKVLINNAKENFRKYQTRLDVVRARKLADFKVQKENKQRQEEGTFYGGGDVDVFSDTSSVGSSSSFTSGSSHSSRRSTSSSRSGKNRRKQERKLLSLKEGSPQEELSLLRSLHETVTSTFSLRGETQSVCQTLVRLQEDIVACELQLGLSDLLKEMERCFNQIWLPELAPSANILTTLETTTDLIYREFRQSVDMSLLDPIYRFPPIITPISWELAMLKKDEM